MMRNQVSQRRHQASQGPQNASHPLLLLSSKASTPTKRRKMLSKHVKKSKARAETDAKTY
jgi:hypothetical protein